MEQINSNDRPLPSPAQLALALAVVKSKPVGTDIKDYILKIRQSIKPANPIRVPYADDQYFDSVSFWKRAYETSEAEQSKLLDRIYDLERRNEALVAKTQSQSVPPEQNSQLKRKPPAQKAVTKRVKTQAHPADRGPSGLGNALRDGTGQDEYMEEQSASFMRHFYTLQKVILRRPTCKDLVHASVVLCKSAGDEILKAINASNSSTGQSKKNTLQSQPPDITSVLRGAETAARLVMQAVKKLSALENGQQHVGNIVYHIVSFYESLMKALEQYCNARSQQILSPAGSKARSTKQKRAKKAKPTSITDKSSLPVDKTAIQLSQTLCTMALTLDFSCAAHYNILEGFLFLLLSRVGTVLSILTFRDLKLRPDLYIDPSKLPLPKGLSADITEQLLLAVRMEGKQLVWLLERLLAMVERVPPTASTAESTHRSFTAKIKDKLQTTLLHAVFGDEAAWGEVLHTPVQPPDELAPHTQENCQTFDQEDWFVQEVWRLLGWEVLTKTLPSER